MFVNVKDYVNFIIKANITERQFLLCYLLYTDAKIKNGKRIFIEKGSAISSIYKFNTHHQNKYGDNAWTKESIEDLINKGFIVQVGNKFSPDMLEITSKFSHLFTTHNHFNEFWNTYPSFVDNFKHSAGRKIRLKACDKDALEEAYLKIVSSEKLHKDVMNVLNWAITNNQISMSIENYIRSRQWNEDKKLMQEYLLEDSQRYGTRKI
jgi:hypothetical protein